jgi:hypothetical protein
MSKKPSNQEEPDPIEQILSLAYRRGLAILRERKKNAEQPQSELIDTQRERIHAEGKRAFGDGKRRGYNPYSDSDQELASIWWEGWDAAKKDSEASRNSS